MCKAPDRHWACGCLFWQMGSLRKSEEKDARSFPNNAYTTLQSAPTRLQHRRDLRLNAPQRFAEFAESSSGTPSRHSRTCKVWTHPKSVTHEFILGFRRVLQLGTENYLHQLYVVKKLLSCGGSLKKRSSNASPLASTPFKRLGAPDQQNRTKSRPAGAIRSHEKASRAELLKTTEADIGDSELLRTPGLLVLPALNEPLPACWNGRSRLTTERRGLSTGLPQNMVGQHCVFPTAEEVLMEVFYERNIIRTAPPNPNPNLDSQRACIVDEVYTRPVLVHPNREQLSIPFRVHAFFSSFPRGDEIRVVEREVLGGLVCDQVHTNLNGERGPPLHDVVHRDAFLVHETSDEIE
ncbi:hypothetical protein DFH09DRAFT_1278860 [Mycena vulgaris]|nr:hypothetical protein DFH09DRAFT_1278860 [Mycena vulgaris]